MAKKGKLPDTETFLKRAFHEGSHPKYTNRVRTRIEEIRSDFIKIKTPTPDDVAKFKLRVEKVTNRYKNRLLTGKEILD